MKWLTKYMAKCQFRVTSVSRGLDQQKLHEVQEWWNDRIIYFGRDLLKLSSPAPKFRQSQSMFGESLPSPGWRVPAFRLFSYERCSSSSPQRLYAGLTSVTLCMVLQMQPHQCLVEKDCLSWTDGSIILNAVLDTFGLLCYEKGFLMSNRTLKFSVGLRSAFQSLGTQRILVSGVMQPRKRNLLFPLMNFTRFRSAHSSSLSKPLWMIPQPSISYSSQFCIICESLLRVCCVSASWSLMKVLKILSSV